MAPLHRLKRVKVAARGLHLAVSSEPPASADRLLRSSPRYFHTFLPSLVRREIPLWRSCRGRRCSFFGEEAQQQCPDSVLGRHKCDNNRDKRDWKEIAVTQEESLKYQGYPRDKAIVPPRTSRMAAVGSERYDMDRGTVSVSTSRLDLPSRLESVLSLP